MNTYQQLQQYLNKRATKIANDLSTINIDLTIVKKLDQQILRAIYRILQYLNQYYGKFFVSGNIENLDKVQMENIKKLLIYAFILMSVHTEFKSTNF